MVFALKIALQKWLTSVEYVRTVPLIVLFVIIILNVLIALPDISFMNKTVLKAALLKHIKLEIIVIPARPTANLVSMIHPANSV